ncbi:MAG TPA: hypothetical protein VFR81_03975 [Longimicrobium sp.]|nr:hypothetical protein [Longimicrobium sp.]
MRIAACIALLSLAVAACATQQAPAPAPESTSSAGACEWPEGHILLIAGGFEALEVKPGESVQLGLETTEGRFSPRSPLPASCRAAWSVEPAGAATVDAAGRLTVPAGTQVGTAFLVAADLGGERARRDVRVADPDPSPIVGTWRQAGPAECGGVAVAADSMGIQELIIRPTGQFSVTWIPFETYKDYWGRYEYDRATGRLAMRVEGGNRVPPGIDLDGRAAVENGRLVMRDIWLGTPSGSPDAPAGGPSCTVSFGR